MSSSTPDRLPLSARQRAIPWVEEMEPLVLNATVEELRDVCCLNSITTNGRKIAIQLRILACVEEYAGSHDLISFNRMKDRLTPFAVARFPPPPPPNRVVVPVPGSRYHRPRLCPQTPVFPGTSGIPRPEPRLSRRRPLPEAAVAQAKAARLAYERYLESNPHLGVFGTGNAVDHLELEK